MTNVNNSELKCLQEYKICFTKFSYDEEKILRSIVKDLGGSYVESLTKDVNILICKEVGSNKYNAAMSECIPCIQKRWLIDCKKTSQFLPLDNYYVGIFTGFRITLSNIELPSRVEFQKLIEENGGKLMLELSRDEKNLTTHLVTSLPSGKKFSYACIWGGIKIVSPDWIHECITRNRWLPEKDFPVVISTTASIISAPTVELITNTTSTPMAIESKSTDRAENDLIVVNKEGIQKELKSEESLYDFEICIDSNIFSGEVFYVSGLAPKILDQAIAYILSGGGQRRLILTDTVNRVVLGDDIDSSTWEAVRSHPAGLQPVGFSWLQKMSKISISTELENEFKIDTTNNENFPPDPIITLNETMKPESSALLCPPLQPPSTRRRSGLLPGSAFLTRPTPMNTSLTEALSSSSSSKLNSMHVNTTEIRKLRRPSRSEVAGGGDIEDNNNQMKRRRNNRKSGLTEEESQMIVFSESLRG